MMYWLPLILFVAHMIEEYPRFPAWASRHFGATSKAWYIYSHILLVALIMGAAWWAQTSPPRSLAPLLVAAIMFSLAGNALFHIVTTVLFREYSPGVVTGSLLFLPAAAWYFDQVQQTENLTASQTIDAVWIGLVVQAAVVASLWLPMDLDWRLRRTRPTD